VPPGREVVVTARVAGLILMLRLEEVDCDEGWVESVTLMVADAAPAELGVPVMAPVALLMDRPPGRLVALKVYGVVPPAAATGLLYAAPTAPAGSAVVVIARLLVWVGFVVGLLVEFEPVHPARRPAAPRIRPIPSFRMAVLSLASL
jgi:hypothetical protein